MKQEELFKQTPQNNSRKESMRETLTVSSAGAKPSPSSFRSRAGSTFGFALRLIKTPRKMIQRVRTLAITSSHSAQQGIVVIDEEEIVTTKVIRLKADLVAIRAIGSVVKSKTAALHVSKSPKMRSMGLRVGGLDGKPLITTQMRSLQTLKMTLTRAISRYYPSTTDRPAQRSTSISLASLQDFLKLRVCRRRLWLTRTLPLLSE